ncbi:MAG TPA: ATP-binding cassette domain-containing protein, partial [Acetobacteraceae bacterium]|nr:ATP-binding cassette domain-containing protein [Acetobacteraceae bacterium]
MLDLLPLPLAGEGWGEGLFLTALVAFHDVAKTYPNGVVALRGVSFAVAEGTCHAICGENGAGKSTLMKILFGLEAPSAGSVEIGG